MFKVAILGRPNVGKSTLFNRLIGRSKALISHKPGLTRDRNYEKCIWKDHKFMVIDTGGLEDQDGDIGRHWIAKNVEIAVLEADVAVFLVDGKEGLNPLDKDIFNWLKRKKKNIVVAVNKIDSFHKESNSSEFYVLGINDVVTISAVHGLGIDNLMDKVVSFFSNLKPKKIYTKASVNVSIIGCPNSGKSSILNKLLGEERVLVNDVPGTTRDSIDTYVTYNKKRYCLVDTAGIRRRKKRSKNEFEHISVIAAEESIKRSDICVLMIDASHGLRDQDLKIASLIDKYLRACVIVVNKWDLVEDKEKEIKKIRNSIKDRFPFLLHSPIIHVSAITGLRVNKIFSYIENVYREFTKHLTKEEIKESFNKIYNRRVPSVSKKGKRFVIKKVVQDGIKPPTFKMTLTNIECIDKNYIRYIKNRLREYFGFKGSPIKITWK